MIYHWSRFLVSIKIPGGIRKPDGAHRTYPLTPLTDQEHFTWLHIPLHPIFKEARNERQL